MKRALQGLLKAAELISNSIPLWLYIAGIASIYAGVAEFSEAVGSIVLGVMLIATAFLFGSGDN
jgi:hypothetical protein